MLPGPAVVIKPTQGMPVIWAPQQASFFISGQHTTTWALTLLSHRKRPGSIISSAMCQWPGKKKQQALICRFQFMIKVDDPVKSNKLWLLTFDHSAMAPGFTHELLDFAHRYHQRVIFQAVFLGDIRQGSKPRSASDSTCGDISSCTSGVL